MSAKNNGLEVKVEKGFLVVRIPLQKPTLSSTGKTFLVASSHGTVKTECVIEGKEVALGFNAFIKA